MGNVKSRNNNDRGNSKISRNLSQPQLTTAPSISSLGETSLVREQKQQKEELQQSTQQHLGGVDKWTTETTTSTSTLTKRRTVDTAARSTRAVGGPLVDIVVNVKNTNDNQAKIADNKNSKKDLQQTQQSQQHKQQRQQKPADSSAACAVVTSKTEEKHQENWEQQQQKHRHQQSLKQASIWSLGSLNWNLSFSGRNSYKQRQKSLRKSFSTLQYQRRLKTQWHRPLTNAIFSSHFKESSRNGEFEIVRLVAKGAFGVVFKVIDKNTKAQHQPQTVAGDLQAKSPPFYALKVLKKSKIISDNSVQQIKDEADIQKLCGHHPFIVKQFDLWQNRYNLHILSEFVPNGELFSKITSFSLNLIRVYLAEIALALDFLHNAGIIYRDAKPENILLTSDFHLKLTDFGLSKWLKHGLTTRTICGTFQYMAPEILRGEPYTHSVDWWSLGIIVCQMFVKKSPDIRQFITVNLPEHFYANDCSLRNKIKAENMQLTEHTEDFLPLETKSLSHEGQDVLQRLLEFDGHKRLQSVRALQRVAMYKDFKIEADYILKIRPFDIIANDNILLNDEKFQSNQHEIDVEKFFKNF